MFVIQPSTLCSCEKELTAIGIRSTISHRQETWFIMFQKKILIIKFFSVDTHRTGPIALGGVILINTIMKSPPWIIKSGIIL